MIVIELQGGLGNQMFQYAAGRALSLCRSTELVLDLSWYKDIAGGTPREYALGAYALPVRIAGEHEAATIKGNRNSLLARAIYYLQKKLQQLPGTFIQEPGYTYWPEFELIQPPAYLQGYWQNECYFASAATTIRKDFAFPPLPDAAKGVAERILSSSCSVAIHIRRGDYVHDAKSSDVHGGCCTKNYYSHAIQTVVSLSGAEPALFLFSDEPNWVRSNFDSLGHPATLVDFPEHDVLPHHDMHLMSLCSHHIIANSSFSWWGAWLGEKGGVVCAPEQWFAPAPGLKGNPCPERWILL